MTTQAAALLHLEDYVNHLRTVDYFFSWTSEIAAAKLIGALFHMGETGTAGCHGLYGVSNTMGALLWEIDYTLYGQVLGWIGFSSIMGMGTFSTRCGNRWP
jgi:hypothetical protein